MNNKFQARSDRRNNSIENFNLNRGMDVFTKNEKTNEMLNDRDMFNHFSNGYEQIDMTNVKPNENANGMPLFNPQILNNKKNLINNPYIQEANDQKHFRALNTMSNLSSNSPFAIAYLWKSLILLSKNPSTDKFLKILQIKKKDEAVNDMKYYSDVFSDIGEIEYSIPYSNGMVNTNFTKKLEEIYKIKVKCADKPNEHDNVPTDNALITLKFKFELKIPFYYQVSIITDYLLDYNTNKIKYLKMLNVPCALDIDREADTVNMEIPMGDNMILGFMYNLSRRNISNPEMLYNKINQKREINKMVKDLYIPKINRNKKINYGKKFTNELKQVHLGEIIYGNMYDIDIISDMELEITIDNNTSNNKYEIISNIDEIKINHRCYFYIKNLSIKNRILFNGMIEY